MLRQSGAHIEYSDGGTFLEQAESIEITCSRVPIVFAWIAGVREIRELTVHQHRYDDESLNKLTSLKQLRSIGLYGESNVSNAGLSGLAMLSELEFISIRGLFDSEAIGELHTLKSLKMIVVGSPNVNDDVFRHLERLPSTCVVFRPECNVSAAAIRRFLATTGPMTIIGSGKYFQKTGSEIVESDH